MISAVWKKIFADLWSNKARSILVTLSIAVGVFAVGIVVSSFSIVKKDMAADYRSVNPHTARIYTDDFGSSLLDALRSMPEVEAIDARYNLWVKIVAKNGRQYPINLNSIESLDSLQVDKLVHENGSRILTYGEIFLERQGAEGLGLIPGDAVNLVLNNGQTYTLTLAGTVHDVFANPFKFNKNTSGYVTPATMAKLGGTSLNNFVSIVSSGSHTDASHVRQAAEQVAEKIKANGFIVYNINATNPGQHPAQSIIDTVLILLGALSVLVILLSAFLVTNTVAALMGQQIRQIGVMKAVGATTLQVIGVYLGLALAFGAIALLIAIPLSALAAYGLSRWLIGMLNATPSAFSIPASSLALQAAIGLVVPVIGALVPVTGGARRTVRQAISSYGLESSSRPGFIDSLLEALPWLPRPLILSLRNTYRRKSRLTLTLATLVLGGAIFIAILSVGESFNAEIKQTAGYFQSDVNVDLVPSYPLDELLSAVKDIPGLERVEGWSVDNGNVFHADGISSDLVEVYAAPAGSQLVTPVMIQGRWLQPEDGRTMVVSNHFHDLRPDIKVGDSITLRVKKTDVPFTVIGIFRIAGNFPSPFIYVNAASLAGIITPAGNVNNLRIGTASHDLGSQEAVLKAVQAHFERSGIQGTLSTGADFIAQQRSQTNTLVYLLLAMGVLIAVVGGLGLMGTMGMNVLERTREIGVMRSIGAQNGTIFQMVVTEGVLIGLLSWVLSLVLAVPITRLLDSRLGERLMTLPITYIFSNRGALIWLVAALALATVASLLPARNAVRLTVRDVLAYE